MEVNDIQENYGAGWISIYRSIKKHWIWSDPIKFKWWIDILLEVNHSEQKVNIGYDLFDCKRGQSVKSLKTWADEWNVSKDTVRNFFTLLKKDNMIETENLKKTTRLTVCNYDSYQTHLHDKQTQSKRKPYAKQTQADPNNNVNKEKNINNVNNNLFTYQKFIILFNEITKRKFKGDSKSEGQFNQRIKKYNGAEFGIAIRNAFKDEYLRQNPKYLTPEYITRENQIEKWLNVIEGEKPKEQTRKKTIYDINNDAYKDPDRLKF